MDTTLTQTEKKKRPWRWIAGLLIVGVVAVALFLFARSRAEAAISSQAQTGEVVEAFIGDLAASATASGQVEPGQTARIPARTSGIVSEVLVQAGDTVDAGDLLVLLDTRDLMLQVERARQNVILSEANLAALRDGASAEDIIAAEATVRSAQVRLDDLLAGPSAEDIAEAEANVRQQQAGVNSATASLGSTRDSVTASQIASAEAELVNAEIAYDQAKEANEAFAFSFTHEALVEAERNLRIAQAKVDELRAGPKQGSLNSASAGVSSAAANLERARADLQKLITGPSAAQIANAEATLAQAQSQLDTLLSGADANDLARAEAELAQAHLNLAAAEENLAKAQVLAPFAGTVTDVLIAEGERASGDVVELVSSDLKVVLSVDEVDVGLLQPGQPATITLETWRDRELPGEVTSIAPSATDRGDGTVTYDVTIAFDSEDLPVLLGMTADARLITAERDGVLLVPNAAITANREDGTFAVNLVTGEIDGVPQSEPVTVSIGLRDDAFTQVNSGLSPGDRVIVGELAAPTIDFDGAFGNGGD